MSDRYEPRHVRPKPAGRSRPLRLAAVLSVVILVATASMPVRAPQRQFGVIPPPDLVAPVEQFPVLADPPLGVDEPEQPEKRSEEKPSTPEPVRSVQVPAQNATSSNAMVLVPAAEMQAQPVLVLAGPTVNPLPAPLPTPVATPAPASPPTAAAAIPSCHPEHPVGKPSKTKGPTK